MKESTERGFACTWLYRGPHLVPSQSGIRGLLDSIGHRVHHVHACSILQVGNGRFEDVWNLVEHPYSLIVLGLHSAISLLLTAPCQSCTHKPDVWVQPQPKAQKEAETL